MNLIELSTILIIVGVTVVDSISFNLQPMQEPVSASLSDYNTTRNKWKF